MRPAREAVQSIDLLIPILLFSFFLFLGTVREFGFMYCDLTGAGFRTAILAKKGENKIACRDEAPSAQRLGTHFDRRIEIAI
jgi:hypothetical protein